MTVNITFLVQSINFLVVYVIIKRLIIDPYLHTKNEYDKEQYVFEQHYMQEYSCLVQSEHNKQKEWKEALDTLLRRIPTNIIVPSLCVPTIQAADLKVDPQQIHQAAETISGIMLNKER